MSNKKRCIPIVIIGSILMFITIAILLVYNLHYTTCKDRQLSTFNNYLDWTYTGGGTICNNQEKCYTCSIMKCPDFKNNTYYYVLKGSGNLNSKQVQICYNDDLKNLKEFEIDPVLMITTNWHTSEMATVTVEMHVDDKIISAFNINRLSDDIDHDYWNLVKYTGSANKICINIIINIDDTPLITSVFLEIDHFSGKFCNKTSYI